MPIRLPTFCNLLAAMLLAWTSPLFGGDEPKEVGDARTVAATVDGTEIYVDQVQREMDRVQRERPLAEEALPALQASALKLLVDRRLVLTFLVRREMGASPSDVNLALERLTARLERAQSSLQQHLEQHSLSEAELRETLAWQLSWQRFLDRYLTDANLARFFQQHRRDFDGTRFRVAHLLLPVDKGDSAAMASAEKRAAEIAGKILQGTLSFSDAAKQFSQAPTADAGGDIGWIGRHGPMPETFSAAAFALEPGEVSEPVVTDFGVHLIQCLEVEEGSSNWQEARDELQRAVTQYLFRWAADQQRAASEVQYTGATAYFDPESGQLRRTTTR